MWDSGLEFFFRGVCSDTAQCYALHVFSLCSSTPLSIIKTLRATGRTLRFCRLKDSRIAAVRLRPEMLISMSVSLKCNEHILGSISLLHFFVCSLTQNFPLLTISGLHGKITIIEIRSFLVSIAANSHLFIAHTERKILQRTRSLPCSQKWETVHRLSCQSWTSLRRKTTANGDFQDGKGAGPGSQHFIVYNLCATWKNP